jgi:hypothetical protein
MKKRTKAGQIHSSFPQEGTVQPNHMGSQSQTPNLDQQLQGPPVPQLPVDSATSMTPQGEY